MDIENLPEEISEQLWPWQIHEIKKRITSPIVAILERDPVWSRIDTGLTAVNNVMNISVVGLEGTIHEILPGHHVVWMMYDYNNDYNNIQVILINSTDLQLIRDGGIDRLAIQSLFKEF
jgi:hypothetical protein